jgi:hypothetical protein
MKQLPDQRGPSHAFALISQDAQDFFDLVERLATASAYNAADYKDGYTRFNRVRNRYDETKSDLKASEREALKKVLEEDGFTRDALSIRVIADHRTNRKGANVPLFTRGSEPLAATTSVASVFRNRRVPVPTRTNSIVYMNHLQILRELERGLRDALRRATESSA